MERVLLLTGFSPGLSYGGGAIVRSLAERFQPGQLAWFCLSTPEPDLPRPLRRLLIDHYAFTPRGAQRLHLGRFWDAYYRGVWTRRAAARVLSAMARIGATTLWTVLDYHVVPVAAELVRRKAAQHYHYSIHDHPNAMAHVHFQSPASIARVAEGFALVKATGSSFDAVSEELLAAAGVIGRPNAVVTMGCRLDRCFSDIRPPAQSGCLRIGYAGSHFPPHRVFQLVEGLKLWSAATGRDWEIHKFGGRTSSPMPPEIIWRGFLTPDALAAELRNMSYLVLAFDGGDAPMSVLAATSLPTKLISYLEAGRLVLAMVPENSVTARIVRDGSMGPILDGTQPQAVANAIDSGLSWDLDAADQGRAALLRGRFNPDSIVERFVGLLRLAEPSLTLTMSRPTAQPAAAAPENQPC